MNAQLPLQRAGTRRCGWLLLLGIALFSLLSADPVMAQGSTFYVTPGGGGGGTSWNDATDLQSALGSATSGDEIWVATGIHLPGTIVSSTFQLKDGVALYGGFAGTESARDQRNWQTNPTVLSGDIDNNDTSKNADGVVTDIVGILGSNAYHVVTGSGVTGTAVLDGFYITAGNAAGSDGFALICGGPCGGGMYNLDGSPTLTDVTFSANRADDNGGGMFNSGSNPSLTTVNFSANVAKYGGGIFNEGSNPSLDQVTISNNRADANGGGMYNGTNFFFLGSNPVLNDVTFSGNRALANGGAMYNDASNPVLTDVNFDGNRASGGGGIFNFQSSPALSDVTFNENIADSEGGGIYNSSSNPTLTDVSFIRNSAAGDGGGLFNLSDSSPTLTSVYFTGNFVGISGGGMSSLNHSNPKLTHVIFRGNRATYGGGMANFTNTPVFISVVFSGNYATKYGGGMYNNGASNPTLTNVTLSGNTADIDGGGIFNESDSDPFIQNTIVWGNDAGSSGKSIVNADISSTPTIRYSLIEGGLPANSVDGGHNLSANPLFVGIVDCGADGCTNDPNTVTDESANDDYGDLQLQSGSPAIDVGDNNADLDGGGPGTQTIVALAEDLAGQPRVVAVQGATALVDMGAYERANDAPTFSSTPPTSAIEKTLYSYAVTTDDETSGNRPITSPQKPAWLALTDNGNGSATLSGTPQNSDVGDHTVVLRAQDAAGASGYQTFTVSVANVNDVPVFTSIAATAATEDSPYSYAITTSDPDAGDSRTLSALTKPAWLTLTDNGDGTGTLGGTPTNGNVGNNPVTLQVQDSGGLTDTQSFTVNVANSNDAPSFTSTPVTTATEGSLYSYTLTTSDPDIGDSRTLSALAAPGWLGVSDNGDGTGTLGGTPGAGDVGDHAVTLQVEDGGGLTVQQSFTVTVIATVPVTGGLTGVVNAGGAGVPGVTVTVNSAAATNAVGTVAVVDEAVTDDQGRYTFDSLTPDPYTLTFAPPVRYDLPKSVDVTVVAGKTTTVPDVTLDPSYRQLYIPYLVQ